MLRGPNGYTPDQYPAGVEGDLVLTNATGGDLTTTLTRPVFYANVTLNATSTGRQFLHSNVGAHLHVAGTLKLTNSKCIAECDGQPGAAGTLGGVQYGNGGAGANGSVEGGAGGGASGKDGLAPTGSADTQAGGAGGDGGASSSSNINPEGDGFAPVYTLATYLPPAALWTRLTGLVMKHTDFTSKRFVGGGGGGAGKPGDTNAASVVAAGGGAGGAGGRWFISAQKIDLSGGGIIRANGGAGGAGSVGPANPGPSSTNVGHGGGGGGGGGGGSLALSYGELILGTGLVQADGGAGGAGGNASNTGKTGGNGGAGGVGGNIYHFSVENTIVAGATGTAGAHGSNS